MADRGAQAVAIFVLQMRTVSRAAGSRGSHATSAAAYRAGERIRDARSGITYDHRRRTDVLHKEIILPSRLGGRVPAWAASRQSLWNAAEAAEPRRNARVAREFMLALPHELAPTQRVQLAQRYAHTLAERYQHAVDLVVHAPRTDPRNFHAHLLATTREANPEGLGRKTDLELSGTQRHRRGLLRWEQERSWLRDRWAEYANEALREARLAARISPTRSLERSPGRVPRLPSIAWHIEQSGRRSVLAERLRAAQTLETLPRPQASRALSWLTPLRERARGLVQDLRERWGLAAAPALRRSTPEPPAPSQSARQPQPARQPESAARAAPARETAARERQFASEGVRAWLAYREHLHSLGPQQRCEFEREQARELERQRQAERDRGWELEP